MGRPRGGMTSKIRALVDADGRPVALKITEGSSARSPSTSATSS